MTWQLCLAACAAPCMLRCAQHLHTAESLPNQRAGSGSCAHTCTLPTELDPCSAVPCCAVQVALLEPAPGNSTLQWPWVSRGTPEPGVNRVQAVSVPVGGASSSSKDGGLLERAIAAVLAGYSGGSSSILSTASEYLCRMLNTGCRTGGLGCYCAPGVFGVVSLRGCSRCPPNAITFLGCGVDSLTTLLTAPVGMHMAFPCAA